MVKIILPNIKSVVPKYGFCQMQVIDFKANFFGFMNLAAFGGTLLTGLP